MKASFALAFLILAAAALFGWKQQGRLAAVRETRLQVMAEARALGLEPDAVLAAGNSPLPSKLGRMDSADKAAAATAFAKELIAFAKEMKAMEKSGVQPDEGMQARAMETLGRLLDFDASQIKQVIAELKASTEIDDKTRGEIIAFSVMMMANDHPEAALAIFTGTSDLKEMQGMGDHIVSAALGKWAEKDPLGALEWIRENSGKHADLVTADAKAAVIAGAAKQDPKLAIRLLDELEPAPEDRGRIAMGLATSARTPEERNGLLTALRESGDQKRELLHGVLGTMAHQVTSENFDESQEWIATAKLSETEMAEFARNIGPWQTKDDTGKWIEWMADKLPPAQLGEKMDQMVTQWTRQDFKAAGEWINGSPEGPTKVAAVKSFAKTVAPYEPETAVQWANTLPAGQEREELLRQIKEAGKPGPAAGGLIREATPDDE